jgi:PAS domain S-box-containing protein
MEQEQAREKEIQQFLQMKEEKLYQSDKKSKEEKLLFYTRLAQNILDAVVSIDVEEKIIGWNDAAEALYGWKVEEVLGKFFDGLLDTQFINITKEAWIASFPIHGSWHGEVRQKKQDGTWMDIQAAISNIIDTKGNTTGKVGIFRDITESKRLERELQERDQQLQAAIEVAKLGIWKLSLATGRLDCSAMNKVHFGFPADEEVDFAMVKEKLSPEGAEKLDRQVRRVLEEKGVCEEKYQVKWPDGSLHWIAISGQGEYGKDGQPTGMNGVTLDITERKMEEERKDIFIGMASHELKTPLTTVKGFTQLLKRQLRRMGLGEQITTLTRMEEQINDLNRLVNELLDVTKIQAGRLEYIWTEVDIDRLVKNVAEMRQQGHKQHSIQVTGAIKRKITGDRSHLEQVFSNLITNAIKYSPHANRVDIWMGNIEESAVVKIRDYGIGIPPGEIAHIFDRFYRTGTARHQAIQGLGMGLYIAKEIIEQHGGRIRVESCEGEGSTFCVELPFSFKPEQISKTTISDSSVGDSARSDK